MKLEHFQEEVDGAARWNFGKLYVEHSSIRDAHFISTRLRRADEAEIAAVTIEPPVRVLVNGITRSDPCFTVKTAGGEPCGLFGIRDSGHPQSAVVWMLGTDDLTSNGLTFLRHSRHWLDELHKNHRLLFNVIDARNTVHRRWLDWMGFDEVQEIEKYGIERRKFYLFRRYV
jgi:hypothetical protein